MATNAPPANQDKIDILTELFRSKKIIDETKTFNLGDKETYKEISKTLSNEVKTRKPNVFRDDPDYKFYNDISWCLIRYNTIEEVYSCFEKHIKDIIQNRKIAKIQMKDPEETRDSVRIDRIDASFDSISYEDSFDIMSKCVELPHREEINKYKTQLEKSLDETKRLGAHAFEQMVQSFVLEATNILIIDNENYIRSRQSLDDKLKECVKTRGITHIIVVYKSRPHDYLKVIGDPNIKVLAIKSDGLTLQKIQIEFTRGNQSQEKPDTYRGDKRGFGASPSVSSHLNNAHDDFMILFTYEICKSLQKNPLIFIEDEQIKVDLLIPSNAIRSVRNYKHILPFLCHVNGRTFYITPKVITLMGNAGKFDNYYLKFGSIDQDHYLQKYLKYKSKYMQLKKLI
jgi:hypothetical protein